MECSKEIAKVGKDRIKGRHVAGELGFEPWRVGGALELLSRVMIGLEVYFLQPYRNGVAVVQNR